MNNLIHFYCYGKLYAPIEWRFDHFPFTNRIYYVYGGTGWYVSDREEIPLRPGCLYFFPANLPFAARQEPNNRLLHLYFDFVLTPPLFSSHPIEIPLTQDSILFHVVRALSLKVETCKKENKSTAQWQQDAVAARLFDCMLKLVVQQGELVQLKDQGLLLALEYIHYHYASKLTVKKLAQVAGLEESYFIRKFEKQMGLSPYRYLKEYRMNAARSLLEQGASVSEAARAVGYEELASFCNAWRKSQGSRPSSVCLPDAEKKPPVRSKE